MRIRGKKLSVLLFGLGLVLVLAGAWLVISSGSDSDGPDKPARLYFYDWENNLIGPARDIQTDLGHAGPKQVLEQQRQKWIAAGRPPAEGYNRQFIAQGAEPTRQAAVELASKQSGETVVVSETPTRIEGRPVRDPEAVGYFVLKDDPALTSDDIRNPRQEADATTHEPIVTFGFTAQGRRAFAELTRRIAQEGTARNTGPPAMEMALRLSGSFVIVLDGRIIERQVVNFLDYPDGIDGRMGFQIAAGFDLTEARQLASLLE